MNRINIEQNNEILKRVDDSLIEYMYNLLKESDTEELDQYLKGRLEIIHGFKDAVDFLEGRFHDLYISSTLGVYIRFKNQTINDYFATHYGDNIGITYNQASAITNIDRVFKGNTDITSFDELEYFVGVSILGYDSFMNCTNLESIDFKNVRIVGNNVFNGCTKLSSIKNYQNVKQWGHSTFNECNLIGDYDFSNMDSIGNENERTLGFTNNTGLTSVVMPLITKYLCLFKGCSSLHTVSGTENIIDIPYDAFYNCTSLRNISFPNVESVGSNAFYNCGLTTLSLPKCTFSNSRAFGDMPNLTTLNLPLITNFNGAPYNPNLETITLGPITEIKGESLRDNPKLTEIIMDDYGTVVTIGRLSFMNSGLITINFPNALTVGGQAFYGCSSLTSVSLPKVTSIGAFAFYNCKQITTMSLPKVTSIGAYCFNGCDKLSEINLPLLTEIDTSSNSGSNAFSGCTSLQTITLGNITAIPNSTFYNDSKLTTLIMPSTLKPTSIGEQTFYNCALLTSSIDISLLTNIPKNAFYGCSKVNFIGLNSGNLTYIGNSAFNNCTQITSIDLSNVTNIDSYGFSGCTNLGEVDLSNLQYLGGGAFGNCTSLSIKDGDLTSIITLDSWIFADNTLTGIIDCGEHLTKVKHEVFARQKCDVIIRSPQVPDVSEGWRNLNMPEGHYLYVLDELVDAYIATGKCSEGRVRGISQLPTT